MQGISRIQSERAVKSSRTLFFVLAFKFKAVVVNSLKRASELISFPPPTVTWFFPKDNLARASCNQHAYLASSILMKSSTEFTNLSLVTDRLLLLLNDL